MSAAAVVIIVTRPRPRPNHEQSDEIRVETMADETMSVSDVLRKAADELDFTPNLPPIE